MQISIAGFIPEMCVDPGTDQEKSFEVLFFYQIFKEIRRP